MRVLGFSALGALVWLVAGLAELFLRIVIFHSFGPGEVVSSYGLRELYVIPLLLYCVPGALSGALVALFTRARGAGARHFCLALQAALLVLFYGGLWVHAGLLRGTGPLEPVSLISSLLLLAAAFLVMAGVRRVASGTARPVLWIAVAGILFACSGLIPALAARRHTASLLSRESGTAPGVLLITLDTTRKDALGPYGNSVFETPVLDSLSAQGVRFTGAVSQSPFTGPSHASLLTGLYPATHGVRTNGMKLAQGTATLASLLAQHGYKTIAVLGGSSLSHDACGLNRGFQVYDEVFTPLEAVMRTSLGQFTWQFLKKTLPGRFAGFYRRLQERKASGCTDAALDWLRKTRGGVFLWVHYFDPHFTYSPPADFSRKYDPEFAAEFRPERYLADPYAIFTNAIGITEKERERAWNLYGGEVSFTDAELGRLLAGVRRMGMMDDMLIVVVADHGEYFGEHGYYFMHDDLYGEVLDVPLLMAGREEYLRGLDGEGVVEVVDIMPTVLQILRMPRPDALQGESLQGREGVAYAFSDCGPCGKIGVRSENGAVIFDIPKGEKERISLPGKGEAAAAEFPALEEALAEWGREVGIGTAAGEAAEESERLKSLGYIW